MNTNAKSKAAMYDQKIRRQFTPDGNEYSKRASSSSPSSQVAAESSPCDLGVERGNAVGSLVSSRDEILSGIKTSLAQLKKNFDRNKLKDIARALNDKVRTYIQCLIAITRFLEAIPFVDVIQLRSFQRLISCLQKIQQFTDDSDIFRPANLQKCHEKGAELKDHLDRFKHHLKDLKELYDRDEEKTDKQKWHELGELIDVEINKLEETCSTFASWCGFDIDSCIESLSEASDITKREGTILALRRLLRSGKQISRLNPSDKLQKVDKIFEGLKCIITVDSTPDPDVNRFLGHFVGSDIFWTSMMPDSDVIAKLLEFLQFLFFTSSAWCSGKNSAMRQIAMGLTGMSAAVEDLRSTVLDNAVQIMNKKSSAANGDADQAADSALEFALTLIESGDNMKWETRSINIFTKIQWSGASNGGPGHIHCLFKALVASSIKPKWQSCCFYSLASAGKLESYKYASRNYALDCSTEAVKNIFLALIGKEPQNLHDIFARRGQCFDTVFAPYIANKALYSQIVSTPFVLHCKTILKIADPATLMRFLLSAAKFLGEINQDFHPSDLKDLSEIIESLQSSLSALSNYFGRSDKQIDLLYCALCDSLVYYAEYFTPIASETKKSAWGGFFTLSNDIKAIVDAITDVPATHTYTLLNHYDKVDQFQNGFEALCYAYADVFDRTTVDFWKSNTASLNQRIYSLYCYVVNPLSKFESRLLEVNQPHNDSDANQYIITEADLKAVCVESKFGKKFPISNSARFMGREELALFGFKFLQHNQVAAVSVSMQQLEQNRNVFMKIGTGQGKSFIIALLAANYALLNPMSRIFVFSCLDHLAVRDYERFKTLFIKMKIESSFLDLGSSSELGNAQILYGCMKDYFILLKKKAISVFHARTNEDLEDCSIFFGSRENDLCILDEFDSLILEHQEHSNYVISHDIFNVSGLNTKSADSLYSSILQSNPSLESGNPDLWRRGSNTYSNLNIKGLFSNYFDLQQRFSLRGKRAAGMDSLGIEVHYVDNDFAEFGNGTCYFDPAFADSLSFLQSFKNVVGFSGSIERSQVKLFSGIFESKSCFVDMPAFFATAGSNAKICYQKSLDHSSWIETISKDISCVIYSKRPILVFAVPTQVNPNDWICLKDRLKVLAKNSGYTFQLIADELDLKKSLGSSGKVYQATQKKMLTLASFVAGRGVDFQVSNEVGDLGGLHVVITFESKLSRGDKCSRVDYLDSRLETQMMGRAARMGAPGSYSVITKTGYKGESDLEVFKVKLDKKDKAVSELSQIILKQLCCAHHCKDPKTNDYWTSWIFFLRLLKYADEDTCLHVLKNLRYGQEESEYMVKIILNTTMNVSSCPIFRIPEFQHNEINFMKHNLPEDMVKPDRYQEFMNRLRVDVGQHSVPMIFGTSHSAEQRPARQASLASKLHDMNKTNPKKKKCFVPQKNGCRIS